jgi:hypothetical protein
MTPSQISKAKDILKYNLETNNDWIVQNTTIETLSMWAKKDDELREWLIPMLEDFTKTGRKSVAGRAQKMLAVLVNIN